MSCSIEVHESYKRDAETFRARTYPIAETPIGGCEWANCRDCDSTILRPVDGEVQS